MGQLVAFVFSTTTPGHVPPPRCLATVATPRPLHAAPALHRRRIIYNTHKLERILSKGTSTRGPHRLRSRHCNNLFISFEDLNCFAFVRNFDFQIVFKSRLRQVCYMLSITIILVVAVTNRLTTTLSHVI